MKFVDRIDETARLKDALTRERASLIVLNVNTKGDYWQK